MSRGIAGLSVGFMVRLTGANVTRVFKGFRSVALAQGWQVHVLRPWDSDERIPELVRQWSLDAAFVHGDLYSSLDQGMWGELPVVTFSPAFPPAGAPPQVSAIAFDDHAIGAMAAEHLKGRGLQDFAYVGFGTAEFAKDRFAGFQAALAGTEVHYCNVLPKLERLIWDRELTPWLHSLPRPCGLFAPCDRWGIIALNCCTMAGISVPGEIAVVSADGDDNQCELNTPALSSIDLPWEQVGRLAANELALKLSSNQPTQRVRRLAPGQVILRKSTDMLAVGDRDVRQALLMIAAQALGPLRPTDVIAELGVSRNKFRDDFRRLVGRTLSQEIRRVRIEEAKRLLAQSDLSIEEVAHRCGFPAPSVLHSAFMESVGTSPGAFRKQRA